MSRPQSNRRNIRSRERSGSTLIECLIALAVFTAGMGTAATLTDQIVYTNDLAHDIATTTTLARNKFEEIRTRDPEQRLALGITSGSSGPVNGSGEMTPSGRYTIEWEFVDAIPHEGIERVTIQVTWQDARGYLRQATFHSGVRKGWPVPYVVPETAPGHPHGKGHNK